METQKLTIKGKLKILSKENLYRLEYVEKPKLCHFQTNIRNSQIQNRKNTELTQVKDTRKIKKNKI